MSERMRGARNLDRHTRCVQASAQIREQALLPMRSIIGGNPYGRNQADLYLRVGLELLKEVLPCFELRIVVEQLLRERERF